MVGLYRFDALRRSVNRNAATSTAIIGVLCAIFVDGGHVARQVP